MKRAGDECIWSSKTKKSDFSEDKVLVNYVSDPPSLKNIALVAVAVRLWECCSCEDRESHIRGRVLNIRKWAKKTLQEILPHSLTHQVSSIIRPIGVHWVEFNDYVGYCYSNKLYKERSYWTMEGTLDRARLHEDVINESKEVSSAEVDYTDLYERACTYCLEKYIPDLWQKVPTKDSMKYYASLPSYRLHIISYWTAYLNNELPNLMLKLVQIDRQNLYDIDLGICENMISSFIVSGNAIALKYFWNYKLTEQEKNSNIGDWISLVMEILKRENFNFFEEHSFDRQDYNAFTDIMCFLLSHLNSQSEQKIVFQTHSKVILLSIFAHWPLQRFFLPTITVMLEFLQESTYVEIMKKIVHSIVKRRTEALLRQIWASSPLNLKKTFIRFLAFCASGIVQLLTVGDNVTVYMILNDASAEEKKLILFRMLEESEFGEFVSSDRFDILTITSLASNTSSLDCDVIWFKETFMSRYAKNLSSGYIYSGDFLELDKLWNWASHSLKETHEFKQNYIDCKCIYLSLIMLGNYERVSDFLNWYFVTEEEASKFKKSFVDEEECISWMKSLSNEGKDGWEQYEKFLNYSFNSSDEVTQLEKVFDEFVKNCESFTESNKEFNTLFKSWCPSSSDEVKIF